MTQTDQHTHSLLKTLEALLWNQREVRIFRAIVALFLDCKLRTTLQNIRGISASTASRFFSCEHAPDEVFWAELNRWQLGQFYRLPRRGRRRDVVLKLDLTCIEKTGKQIPFARVFNRRYGIQLVVLHACVGRLSFPLGYRIYRGKGKATVTDLALELLAAFPASGWSSRTVVLADAGFGSTEFIQGCQALGFKRLLVGMRCNRQLADGRQLTDLSERGEQVILHDLPTHPLWLSWCDVKREEGTTSPLPLLPLAPTWHAGTAVDGSSNLSSNPSNTTLASKKRVCAPTQASDYGSSWPVLPIASPVWPATGTSSRSPSWRLLRTFWKA